MSDCPHEIWERESDVTADGSCPICLRAEIARLRECGELMDAGIRLAWKERDELRTENERLTAYVEEWKKRYETARLAHEEGRAALLLSQSQRAEIARLRKEVAELLDALSLPCPTCGDTFS